MSWPLGTVSEIAEIISGYAFKSEWFGDGSNKVIRIGDLQDGRIQLDSALCVDAKINNVSSQFKIQPKDILMALSGATVGKIAIAQECDAGAYINQRVAIIRGKTPEAAEFLKYVFSGALQEKLLLSAGGAAQPNLSPKSLALMEIPLPPLAEQKRIAAILDKADAIRRKRQQAIKLADEFLRSVFLDMFGDPVSNPKGFPVGTIRDMVESANYGTSGKASETEGEFPILRMGNITYEGGWNFDSLKYIDMNEKEKDKYLVKNGDLVFNRTNSKELVGKTAVFEGNRDMVIAGYLIRVRCNRKGNTRYISGYLNSKHGKKTLEAMCKSIVGMANINTQELQDIKVLIPPIELQNKFAELVMSCNQKFEHFNQAEDMAKSLFESLSQKAFSGNL